MLPSRHAGPDLAIRTSAIVLALALLPPNHASAQPPTFAVPPGVATASLGSQSSHPFGMTADQTWHWIYSRGDFSVQGPMWIHELEVRISDPNASSPGASCSSLEIALGTTSTGPGGQPPVFADHFDPGSRQVVRTGPWASGPIASSRGPVGQWVSLGLSSPYFFDPSCANQHLVVALRLCGILSTMPDIDVKGSAAMGHHYGAMNDCAALAWSFETGRDVILRVTYTPATAAWETNSPSATLRIGQGSGPPCGPIEIHSCVNVPTSLSATSTNPGAGWEMALTSPEPGVPAHRGGFITLGGQVVNIDPAAASFTLLNGLSFPPFSDIHNLPVVSAVPRVVSAQMAIIDPGHADGAALSALNTLRFSGTQPVAGPQEDYEAVLIRLGVPPLCGPPSIPFFGTSYTQFYVSSNGRVTFGVPANNFAPANVSATLSGVPYVGAWADFDPSAGGAITISNPTAAKVRVAFQNVPYSFENPAIGNSFDIDFDASTGAVTLAGLLGIAPHPALVPDPGDSMCLGVSIGAGATLGAQTPFAVGGPFSPASYTVQLFRWGMAGTLTQGLDTLLFVPSLTQSPNYDWTGM